jgi:hypothetical protein
MGRGMATRAEEFKAAEQRKRPRLPERLDRVPPPGLVVDTSLPGTSATLRRKGGLSTAARNRAAHAGRKASFALQDSLAPARPTRKSTRSGENRVKPENNYERRQKRRDSSPARRAEKAAARSR